jgi:uncharacterized caspase-like protein
MRPVLLAAVLLAAAPAAAATPETYAVIIGHNGGRAGLPPLRYADDDAVRFARFFSASPDAHLWLLTRLDADTERQLARAEIPAPARVPPTRSAVLAAFAQVRRALTAPHPGRERVLYVVYAGHGLRGRVLLEPEGGDEAAITGAELRAVLAELAWIDPQLRMFLFIDACRSQSLFGERDGEAGPDFSSEVSALERRAESLRLGVLTAASTGKPAGEVEDLEAGYFSHALASGLAGAADADGDDIVSFGELAAFVAFNTRRLTGQLPWFDPPGGDLGAVAIDLRARLPRLVIPAAERGRFLVEARGGPPVFAEVFKDGARPLRLALPPGHYRLRHAAEGRMLAAPAELQPGQSLDAGALAWSEARSEARGPAPEVDLAFSAPFTPEAVSTLEAGFQAGRQPSAPFAARAIRVALSFIGGTSPFQLSGAELGVAVGVRRNFGSSAVAGVRLSYASSSHRAGLDEYRLERPGLLVEGGVRLVQRPEYELYPLVGVGGAAVLRRGSGPTSGDPFAPTISAGLGQQLSLGGRRWAAFLEVRALVQWVRVDGTREAYRGLLGDLGVAWAL